MNAKTMCRNMNSRQRAAVKLLALCGIFVLCPLVAHASTTSSTGLDWETPLQKFSDSIRGPVAFTISLLGLVVTGASLVLGGELNELVRRFIMLIMAISVIVFASNMLSTLFGVGAVV